MSDPYYPFYPGDYQRDTSDLSLLEHGAYRVLLDTYYINRGLPADKDRLFRITKAMTDDEKEAVVTISKRFFTENGDGTLKNNRADKEIFKRDEFLKEQKRKSDLGLKARGLTPGQPTGKPPDRPTGKPGEQPNLSPSPSPDLKEKEIKKEKEKDDFFSKIEKTAREIEKLKLPGFNIWAWTQTQVNRQIHPGAILETMEGAREYLKETKNPTAYLNSIIKTKGPNWREKGFIAAGEADKKMWADLVKKLEGLHNG